jgi:hypothetical protein
VKAAAAVAASAALFVFASLVPAAAGAASPSIVVKQPWSGQSVSSWIGLRVEITYDVGVLRVDYAVDGKNVAYDDTPTDFSEPWQSSTVADGAHTIVATARDSAGRTFSSPPVSFTTKNGTTSSPPPPPPPPPPPTDTSPPTATLVSPVAGSVLSGAASLSAFASDNVDVVAVEFSADGVLVSRDTSPPWGATWDTTKVANGPHTLVARAFDAAGNAASSPGVQVSVSNAAPAPAPAPPPGTCARPYAASSPWNTPIGSAPALHANSAYFVSSMTPVLTSDPTQYTYPVYYADAASPLATVTLSGRFSNVTSETAMTLQSGGTVAVPIPATAAAAAGSDAQLIILKPSTGDEWGFWRLAKDSSGRWTATNGYHYNTSWSGVPPRGFGSRGAGVPYLAGLVRPCEIARGSIDHALAFAYDYPTSAFVWPATKSDGKGTLANDMPEGARLQLDPSLTRDELVAMGVTGAALTVAQALQRYGMYLIDASGREKVMFEYDGTAHWNGLISASTVSKIPLSQFRWVDAG